jgi:septal ring factor EnvC (AmiA/AmiB activator)
VVQLRDKLAQTQAERARLEQTVAEIGQEQTRIRENMGKLAQNSDLYTRYVTKLDRQETELDDLRKKIEALKDTEARQQRELNDFLGSLEVE